MNVDIHPHAKMRMSERGVEEGEIIDTVEKGEQFPAKYGRTGFRCNFVFDKLWNGKHYSLKQIEAYAVKENNNWLVITIIAKYF